jgi:hypothetical protein
MASLMAEFASPELLLTALRSLRGSGHTQLAAYTPFPVPEVDEVLEIPRSWIAPFTLACGLTGAAFGFALQLYLNGINYPLAVGGFPSMSPLAFVPITFESTILFSVLGAVGALFAATKLPQLWHPVFEVPEVISATSNGFWLAVETDDIHGCADKLRELGASTITDAPPGVT